MTRHIAPLILCKKCGASGSVPGPSRARIEVGPDGGHFLPAGMVTCPACGGSGISPESLAGCCGGGSEEVCGGGHGDTVLST
jgi:hypothetical protein